MTAPLSRERCYCGSLDWTVERYGRVTHKEGCPRRTDPWHQGDPQTGELVAGLRAEIVRLRAVVAARDETIIRLEAAGDKLADALDNIDTRAVPAPIDRAINAWRELRWQVAVGEEKERCQEPTAMCPNGPDEYGNWPCDPDPHGDGTASCLVCGFRARWLPRGGSGVPAGRSSVTLSPLERADKVRPCFEEWLIGDSHFPVQDTLNELLPAGAVILTPEETEQVRFALARGGYRAEVHQTEIWKPCRSALALLGVPGRETPR